MWFLCQKRSYPKVVTCCYSCKLYKLRWPYGIQETRAERLMPKINFIPLIHSPIPCFFRERCKINTMHDFPITQSSVLFITPQLRYHTALMSGAIVLNSLQSKKKYIISNLLNGGIFMNVWNESASLIRSFCVSLPSCWLFSWSIFFTSHPPPCRWLLRC